MGKNFKNGNGLAALPKNYNKFAIISEKLFRQH